MAGIDAFTVTDELYLSELHGPNHVLLHTHFNGKAQRGFAEREWFSDERRPVLYLHRHGSRRGLVFHAWGIAAGDSTCSPTLRTIRPWSGVVGSRPCTTRFWRAAIRWVTRLDV